MGEIRKPTQFLKVLHRLINSSISGIDGYELEREYLSEKLKRTTEKTSDGAGQYYRYEVANAKQLKEVVATYKAKGGELSAVEEKQAYSRFE